MQAVRPSRTGQGRVEDDRKIGLVWDGMGWYGREDIRAIITISVAVGICEMRSGQDRFEFHLTLLPSLLDSSKK